MNIAIRVDASHEIGIGHFMRCLTLAKQLKRHGASIRFLSKEMPSLHQKNIVESGFEFVLLPEMTKFFGQSDGLAHASWLGGASQEYDAQSTIEALHGKTWNWLIVDHYALDRRWEKIVRQSVIQIMVIDDLADRKHDADILLDQNIYPNPEDRYKNKIPKNCLLLLGASNMLLRSEFVLRKKNLSKNTKKIQRILIFFGGGDIHNHTEATIDCLSTFNKNDINVDVVVGAGHRNLSGIEAKCAKYFYSLHINVDATCMANLMAIADLGVGAGGIATYERLYMLLPSLLTPTSLNQKEPLCAMRDMGLFSLFNNQDDLRLQLEDIFKAGITPVRDCVEDGVGKVVGAIFGNTISLHQFNVFDVRRTFRWLQNPQLRTSFLMTETPTVREHFKYWKKIRDDESQKAFSILKGGVHIGNCGLKHIDYRNGHCELWIYIGEAVFRGAGLGRLALKALIHEAKKMEIKRIYLHVNRLNKVAIELYLSVGFLISQDILNKEWLSKGIDIVKMEIEL